MEKQFAVKVFNRIRAIEENKQKLLALGINLEGYEDGVELLTESVCMLFAKNEKIFEKVLEDVLWWLSEKTPPNLNIVGVETAEKFIVWLENKYGALA